MFWIRVPAHNLHIASDAPGWGITGLVIGWSAVDFLQLRIVNVRAKSILNRSPISIRAKVKAVEPADYKNRITRC